ncbi:hypothetical protein ACH5RR_037473, partial [Cinchona calisaya]
MALPIKIRGIEARRVSYGFNSKYTRSQGVVAKVSSIVDGVLMKEERKALVQQVSSLISTYYSQCYPFPKPYVRTLIESRGYFFGKQQKKRKLHLVSWKTICQSID